MTAASASPPHGAGYSVGMRALHWATAALLVGSYASAWTVSLASSNAGATQLVLLHRTCGVIILVMTAKRFVWRQRTGTPHLPADVPILQRMAARANVVGLYTLLVLQPLIGLTASMLHGDRLVLLGGLLVPDLLPVDRKLAHVVFQVHGTAALLLLGLIGLHAAAALYHHFVRNDDVLVGMLPGLMRRSGPRPPTLLHRGRRQ